MPGTWRLEAESARERVSMVVVVPGMLVESEVLSVAAEEGALVNEVPLTHLVDI